MKRDPELDSKFELFWTLYPKKQSKGAARREFYKVYEGSEWFDRLMTSVRKHLATQWWISKPHAVPFPSTYLKDEMIDDQLEAYQFEDGIDPDEKPTINFREIE